MSGSITFRHGPYRGWTVSLFAAFDAGELVSTTVHLETPRRDGERVGLSGILTFSPGVAGFGVSRAAAMTGGPDRYADLLGWIIEATDEALERRTDVTADARDHWQGIVDRAADSQAEWVDSYPDGKVPAFEVVGRLSVDVRDLAGAR